MGITPKLTDAELLTLTVMQALLGYVLRGPLAAPSPHPPARPVPYLPGQSGSNKRLRAAFPLLRYFIGALASDTDLWADPVWVADSTPIECAPLPRHRAPLGPGRLGRLWLLPLPHPLVWGLRLHLVCTLHGLPVAFALANPKADERQVLLDLLASSPS